MRNIFRAAIAGITVLAACAACTSSVSGSPSLSPAGHAAGAPAGRSSSTPSTGRSSNSTPSTGSTPSTRTSPPVKKKLAGIKVHASLEEADGQTYGVGMPIIMEFDKSVTSATAFTRAITVTVNGQPAAGAWYFEHAQQSGYALEAHYRLKDFWPAHSHVEVDAPLEGVSAGAGRVFDDNLTLSISIGAKVVSTVDASATDPHMVVRSDGNVVKRLAVSLGTAQNPTYKGTKVVEEFDRVEDMEGTPVAWSVRLTNSGEFVHAAPWNSDIGRANLSHGCTNLSTSDAEWYYHYSHLGDVVQYPNAPGPTMNEWDGLGDWNVLWSQWRSGGLL